MSEISTHDIGGIEWYVLSRAFPSDADASRAFTRTHELGVRQKGKLNVGIYRHYRPGAPERFVTVLGLNRHGVNEAGRILGGAPNTLDEVTIRALCLRRARVVLGLAAEGKTSGSYRIPHGFPGEHMNRDGTMADD